MKIGSKIALFYTLISVLTTVIIIAVFYIFSTQYINKLYASYLREKAYLTAQKHWEKDEVDEQSYQIIFDTLQVFLLCFVRFSGNSSISIFRSSQIVLNELFFMIRIRFQFIQRHLQEIEDSRTCRFAFHCIYRLTRLT